MGYHPGDYAYPKNENQALEICLGAILTQNTNWNNVLSALKRLDEEMGISVNNLLEIPQDQLALFIKSAGYFNQKADYLKNFIRFIHENPYNELKNKEAGFLREELIKIKGIGEETADSILLYAFKKPSFVIDAYTKRILIHLGLITSKTKYACAKKLFESALEPDVALYQEYHALIVKHGKMYYSKKPYGLNDPILTSGIN